MSKIAIVTDSTANLSNELVEQYGITVIPLMVNFDQESYKDGVDLTPDRFYARLLQEKALPTTSQPAVGEVVVAYEHLLETHDAIIGIFLSSELSGTAASAETAARMVGGDITVIDSKVTGSGQAHLVIRACEMVKEGRPKAEIVETITAMREQIDAFFVVDSLEHLHRGGRIGGVSAALGTLLQVKPILRVQNGKLELFEKVRTRKKAFARSMELVLENSKGGVPLTITVVYTDSIDDAKGLEEQVKAEFPQARTYLAQLSPVIGTHVGPGMMGLMFFPQ